MKSDHTSIMPRDGRLESPWQNGLYSNAVNKLANNPVVIYDCLVIGGGITGLTAALMLQQSGKNTMIAEANNIGFGTTGGTSAHINTFADTTYTEAESAFGEKCARQFADAVNAGFSIIKDNIETYAIDCDYETKAGFVYAETDDEVKQLQKLYDGTAKVWVPIEFADELPVPIPYKKAVKLEGQAQFHPLKYLQALEREYLKAGGVISEHTLIDSLTTKDELHTVHSADKSFTAENIIYATHMPPGINAFNFKCAPYRSYVMAVKLKNDKYPNALVYDMQEPYHYFRTHTIDGERLLIAGGNDHKTGHEDPVKMFDDLEKYIRKYFNVSSVKYKWSSQYYVPVDGLPYIGQMPFAAKGIFCATGFNGNGMMLGSAAAKTLCELVCGEEAAYKELFDPCRIKPIDGFKEFVTENADVAYHFFADRFGIHETDSLKRIQPGTGKVVEVDGVKIAAYRDESGEIHALNPVCTHAKCVVGWNQEEKSWDCPCHGARFDTDGKVLCGPAQHALEKISTAVAAETHE